MSNLGILRMESDASLEEEEMYSQLIMELDLRITVDISTLVRIRVLSS